MAATCPWDISPLSFFSECTSCEFVLASYFCEFVVNKVCILLYSFYMSLPYSPALRKCRMTLRMYNKRFLSLVYVAGTCPEGLWRRGHAQYRVALRFTGSLILRIGDFLCFAGTKVCDWKRLVFLAVD